MSDNPFIVYRDRLDSHAKALAGGLDDAWFVDCVEALDAKVAAVHGHGFEVTPVVSGEALAQALGVDLDLWIKDETGNVGDSHKARHLFGVALHLLVDEALGAERCDDLAIASCGNAALGAGVIARALDRKLSVFVPDWADQAVLDRLDELGANVRTCERRAGEAGDPAYLRFSEAVAEGARPFSVQGTDTPTTFDGGRTIGWELNDQLPGIEVVYVQVGGAALATAVALAMPEARVVPVQSAGCAPLRAAWDRLSPDFDFAHAADHPDEYMSAWPTEPTSLATGILDDVTYDWLPLLTEVHRAHSEPIVAPENNIVQAHELAHAHTDVPVCVTGTAGLAGLLTDPPEPGTRTALLFTGLLR